MNARTDHRAERAYALDFEFENAIMMPSPPLIDSSSISPIIGQHITMSDDFTTSGSRVTLPWDTDYVYIKRIDSNASAAAAAPSAVPPNRIGDSHNSANARNILIFRGIYALQSVDVRRAFMNNPEGPHSPLFVPFACMHDPRWSHISSLAVILFFSRYSPRLIRIVDGIPTIDDDALVTLLPVLTRIAYEVRRTIIASLRAVGHVVMPPKQKATNDITRTWRQWWGPIEKPKPNQPTSAITNIFDKPYLPFQQRYSNTDLEFHSEFNQYMMKLKANKQEDARIGNHRASAGICTVWSFMKQLIEQQPSGVDIDGLHPIVGDELVSHIKRVKDAFMNSVIHVNPNVSSSKNLVHALRYAVGLKSYVQGNIKIKERDIQRFEYGRINSQPSRIGIGDSVQYHQPPKCRACTPSRSCGAVDCIHQHADHPIYISPNVGDFISSVMVYEMPRTEIDNDYVVDVQRCNSATTSEPKLLWIKGQVKYENEVCFYGHIEEQFIIAPNEGEYRLHIVNWDERSIMSIRSGSISPDRARQYATYGITSSTLDDDHIKVGILSIRSCILRLMRTLHSSTSIYDVNIDAEIRSWLAWLVYRNVYKKLSAIMELPSNFKENISHKIFMVKEATGKSAR